MMRGVTRSPVLALVPLLLLFVAMSLWFPRHPSDERGYLTLARNLTHGQYTGLGWRPANPFPSPDPAKPDLWFGPGLPVVAAPLVAAGAPVRVVRLLGPIELFAAVLVFFALMRLYVARRPALLGALALGLYFPFYTLLPNLHSEPLAILLVVAAMYATARYLRGRNRGYAALAALAVGWLAVTRVEYGWVITLTLAAAIVWWAIARSAAARRVMIVFAGGLVLCVPWLAFTYSVTGQPFLWGNSGPLSLYWMSSPAAQDLGDWRGGAREILITDPRLAQHRPFFRELARLDPVEQNRRLERAALDNIRSHPGKFLKNVAANVSRLWFDAPFSAKQESLKMLFYLLPNVLVLAALLASGALLVRARSSIALPPELLAFVGFGIVALAVHAVLAAFPRMLMPIVPVAAWLVTYSLAVPTRTAGDVLDRRPPREAPRRVPSRAIGE
jgi:hypothetical protein